MHTGSYGAIAEHSNDGVTKQQQQQRAAGNSGYRSISVGGTSGSQGADAKQLHRGDEVLRGNGSAPASKDGETLPLLETRRVHDMESGAGVDDGGVMGGIGEADMKESAGSAQNSSWMPRLFK